MRLAPTMQGTRTTHRTAIRQQRGSTLMVALIMLVLLTLIALSAMKGTTTSIQVVGNAQFREEAKAAAQAAIETVLSTNTFETVAPTPLPIDINNDGATDFTVSFAPKPTCTSSTAVSQTDVGVPSVCASSIGAVCFWTFWDVSAVVTDVNTGASVTVHQGIKTIAGSNAVANAGC